MHASAIASERPWISLTAVFCAWKALLLAVTLAAPGPGYDTSTQILFQGSNRTDHDWTVTESVVARLTRWDALYFTSGSRDGNVFEQEWAFSWTLKHLVNSVVGIVSADTPHSFVVYALTGIILSTLAHFISVFVVYRLVHAIVYDDNEGDRLAFATAALHIISPAGLFLAAPYGESLFSLLNMLGMLQYALAMHNQGSYIKTRILISGLAFALATLVRSNGLLSGVIYAIDVFALQLNMIGRRVTPADSHLLLAKYVAGASVGLGFVMPQVIAYREYCTDGRTRPWCERLIPSIYNWVQAQYWGVGFLRYWTLPNLPLFLLAAPMLALMLATACSVHLSQFSYLSKRLSVMPAKTKPKQQKQKPPQRYANSTIRRLALPQALLALLAFTNFHVQIITRLSSGYPVWYFLLARALADDQRWFGWIKPQWVVKWMVIYALVQGALFASFLPPA